MEKEDEGGGSDSYRRESDEEYMECVLLAEENRVSINDALAYLLICVQLSI